MVDLLQPYWLPIGERIPGRIVDDDIDIYPGSDPLHPTWIFSWLDST